MPYTRINWEDLPSTNTPVNSTNLNKMDAELEKLGGVIVTASNQDCNNYTEEGIYWFSSAIPSNSPAGGIWGWLQVITQTGSSTIRQIWHRAGTLNGTTEYETYVREKRSGTWSAWKKFAMGEIFEEPTQEITSNSNLNNYTTPGVYRCPNSTTAGTLTNTPTTNVGFKLIVECTSAGNRYRQTIYANRISGDLTYVRHYNGSWGNWYKYNMTQV